MKIEGLAKKGDAPWSRAEEGRIGLESRNQGLVWGLGPPSGCWVVQRSYFLHGLGSFCANVCSDSLLPLLVPSLPFVNLWVSVSSLGPPFAFSAVWLGVLL